MPYWRGGTTLTATDLRNSITWHNAWSTAEPHDHAPPDSEDIELLYSQPTDRLQKTH